MTKVVRAMEDVVDQLKVEQAKEKKYNQFWLIGLEYSLKVLSEDLPKETMGFYDARMNVIETVMAKIENQKDYIEEREGYYDYLIESVNKAKEIMINAGR